METIRYTPKGGRLLPACVVAIGVFDGVHLGHRALLSAARARADALGLPLVVFTFPPEMPGVKTAPPLYPAEEKERLLSACGVDAAVFAPFPAVRDLSAEAFVNDVLLGELGAALAVCGYDFRFGAGAAGTPETLTFLMKKSGGDVLILPPTLFEGEPLSTTRVRAFLSAGDVLRANAALGAPYTYRGTVAHGLRLGREIGMPTLNLPVPEGLFIPKTGVYAALCTLGGAEYPALANLGTCPTFGAREVHYEIHLVSDVPDAYGEAASVTLLKYLRPERTFPSAEALTAQIKKDMEEAKNL